MKRIAQSIHKKRSSSSADPDTSEKDEVSISKKKEPSLTLRAVHDRIYDWMERFTEITNERPLDREKLEASIESFYAKDFILMRPSGNPLDRNGMVRMFESQKMSEFTHDMIAIESTKILPPGNAASMVFKSEQCFVYEGKSNQDYAAWTAVLIIEDGEIKITNLHRSAGIPR
jgi:hypothetical protein